MVFAASLNPISADGYLFTDPAHRSAYDGFRRSFATMKALPCDVLISAHPDQSGGDEKATKLRAGATPNPFVDPAACRTYAAHFEKLFDQRIADERAHNVR
jgi:metallo-beta-lactamase class B